MSESARTDGGNDEDEDEDENDDDVVVVVGEGKLRQSEIRRERF